MTIVEFLTARLDEAEENVQSEIRFSKSAGRDLKDWGKYVYDPVIGPYGGQSRLRDAATGIYIAKAADPTRVLADIVAKRAIIEWAVEYMEGDYAPWNEQALCILASVYADHPDYQQGWVVQSTEDRSSSTS